MPAAGPQVILFDVMGTLVYNPFFVEIPAFFGISLEELQRCKHPTSWIEFESGAINQQEYLARLFADRRPFNHAAFLACMASAYRWLDGMEACVADIRAAGHTLHTLSNYPPWFRTIEEKLKLSRWVEWTFVSCLTGLRKPAKDAFLKAAQHLGRAPRECLLVDDSAENCAAAEAAGMPALHFRNATDLRLELRSRGLV